jgi:hypothetical protein
LGLNNNLKKYNMDVLQLFSRVAYKALVLGFLILHFEPKAFYALPISILVSLLTESENIIKLKK